MRKIKATPTGLAFTEADSPTARLSDVGYYAIKIEPVEEPHGLVVYGTIGRCLSVDKTGRDYAEALFDLYCKPATGGKETRYYVSDDLRYGCPYTKSGLGQFFSEVLGEPCEIEIVGEEE